MNQPRKPKPRGRLPITAPNLAAAGVTYDPDSGSFTPPHRLRFGQPEVAFDGRFVRADRIAAVLMG